MITARQLVLLLGALSCTRTQPGARDVLGAAVERRLQQNRQRPDLEPTVPGLRVAFVGDQGVASASIAALQLVRRRTANLLVILGDFDYLDRPQAWLAMLDRHLGPLPWLAVAGNHDRLHFGRAGGYADIIATRSAELPGGYCSGAPGRAQSCLFYGLHIVLSDVGLMSSGEVGADFVAGALADSRQLWRVCAWHKNQRDMQVGRKGDGVGWAAYRACQHGGGMVLTGHEHSYARTLTLSNIGDREDGHGATGSPDRVSVGPGRTFVSVVGTGGKSLRPFAADLHGNDRWWAAYYTLDRELAAGTARAVDNAADLSGVLFIDFGVEGDPRRARGWFETSLERVVDTFEIRAD